MGPHKGERDGFVYGSREYALSSLGVIFKLSVNSLNIRPKCWIHTAMRLQYTVHKYGVSLSSVYNALFEYLPPALHNPLSFNFLSTTPSTNFSSTPSPTPKPCSKYAFTCFSIYFPLISTSTFTLAPSFFPGITSFSCV